jgi:8-oxo-dGTP diphosphatase
VAHRALLVAAVYVVLRRRGEVLLLLRQGTGYMDGMWALPAGHLEPDESVEQAAIRETAEESGVTIAARDLVPLTTQHRFVPNGTQIEQRADFYFTASRWSNVPRIREPDKCGDMRWFTLDALPLNLVNHERVILDELRAGTVPAIMSLRG